MENADQYYNKDGWPPESDRAVFLRLASETPILEVNFINSYWFNFEIINARNTWTIQ